MHVLSYVLDSTLTYHCSAYRDSCFAAHQKGTTLGMGSKKTSLAGNSTGSSVAFSAVQPDMSLGMAKAVAAIVAETRGHLEQLRYFPETPPTKKA